ncbi:MAG: hypothetical protein ACF8CQ_15405 [Rhodopirellula sp. JB044]|uniref:hypothetical protein n=1 Tax=Rhodopirellula sp. JB044 TaxID=3342844 RepID=UPI00370BFCD9
MNTHQDDFLPATLDPPGTIAVLGTTPIGIEAALYGRYLGYNVTLLAAADLWKQPTVREGMPPRIGPTFHDDWFAQHWLGEKSIDERWTDGLPMLPDRSLSPLAISAISAQREDEPAALPVTMQQWIEDGLQQVIATDLLRGRVHSNTFVDAIALAPVVDEEGDAEASEGEDDSEEDIPPDFLLSLSGEPIESAENGQLRAECVIVADLPSDFCRRDFDLPADYFFHLRMPNQVDAADALRPGWQQIAEVFAGLAGRPDLDLYRPQRV